MRLATEEYTAPNDINQRNLFMHLTNYAINKNSKKFVENEDDDDEAHKRSLKSLYQTLQLQGYNVAKLQSEIEAIVIKTCIVA